MLASISAILVLLVLSAFFSGSETALTAASRPLMHHMEQEGDRRAARVNRLQENKERLIGALLLGNNLVNISASALATGVLIALFGEAGVIYATIAMTALVLVFSEILPKTYAIAAPNKVALAVAPVVDVMVRVFAPVTASLQLIVRGLLWVVGFRGDATRIATTAEELRGAIALHAGEKPQVRHERAMLRSILDLADVEVGEIMTHRRNVVMIDVNEEPQAIVQQVLDSPYTRLPLWRDEPDNIVGLLHVKALLRALQTQGGKVEGLDIEALATQPWFIPESTSLLDQLQAFRLRREHFAVVVDEYGTFKGIVTLEDILEEIVGDISDEHDIMKLGIRPLPNGSFIVDGTVTIRDLNREFDWRLPDEEASTVAGLVIHEARRIPDPGQVFRFYGLRFQVLRRQRNQITSLRVTPLDAARTDTDGANG